MDIELNIINAHALDPTKAYIIEVDRNKVSDAIVDKLSHALTHIGINFVLIRTKGGDGLRIVPSEASN